VCAFAVQAALAPCLENVGLPSKKIAKKIIQLLHEIGSNMQE
jgi:hypothetical protein